MSDTFCSLISRDAAEPLIGTATRNTCHFVMAIPKAEWLPLVEEMDGAAGELARLIKPLKDQAILSLRNAPPEERGAIWLFPHGYRFDGLTPDDYPALVKQALSGAISLPYTIMANRTTILICTHGKRDACCAKFGIEVLDALKAQAPAEINVWEVSHLGGHRFAATLVVQPANQWYGRLSPSDVPTLLNAIQNHTVLRDHYRGNANFPPPLQAAEAWGWEQLGDEPGEIYLLNPHINGTNANVVVVREVNGELQKTNLALQGEPLHFLASCSGETNDRLVWRVTEEVKDGIPA
jgi:hypothetical protein